MATSRELTTAARQLSPLLERVDDQRLTDPTPCTEFTVRDLLAHLLGLTLAFRYAATKAKLPAPGEGDTELEDWRNRLPAQLDALAIAWQDPHAWDGMTEVGGITLPGATAGGFAINELILHGWDLAQATGQAWSCDPAVAEVALTFTSDALEAGFGDAYGPPVKIPDSAPTFDRLLGMTGRDPSWTAPHEDR